MPDNDLDQTVDDGVLPTGGPLPPKDPNPTQPPPGTPCETEEEPPVE